MSPVAALQARLALAAAVAILSVSAPAHAAATRPSPQMPTSSRVDTSRVVLRVKGMFCTSCEHTVAAMLARTPGVVRAQVSVKRGDAVVLYDPARTSAPALIAVIERLGYHAAVSPAKART